MPHNDSAEVLLPEVKVVEALGLVGRHTVLDDSAHLVIFHCKELGPSTLETSSHWLSASANSILFKG